MADWLTATYDPTQRGHRQGNITASLLPSCDTQDSLEANDCSRRLEEAISLLRATTQLDHVLNVTCHVKVYDYLHGLFCHAQLVIIRCRGNTSERCLVSLRELEQVRQHKIKFYLNIVIFFMAKKMTCLHPSLKQLVSHTLHQQHRQHMSPTT
ncbi:hypothetical protein NP493_126g09019 [Ridgeia piscesae]|uniref:Uncharacterized protein n=1 Tax=Ridgeia piscesae TaxID=27915 RepID=A0AAD9UGJ2_RIDPI|nr:hypothetical protein NP493_126g09019 [Ridgeia piscesae]